MPQDILEQIEVYRASEPDQWAKLASNVQWRRLVLLLLREIVVELRALRQGALNGHPRPVQGQDS